MAFMIDTSKPEKPHRVYDWDFETVEYLPKSKRSKWELLDWDWKVRRVLSTMLGISPILCAYHGTYKGEENMIKLILLLRPKTFKTIYIQGECFEASVKEKIESFLSEIYELKKVPKEKIRKKVNEVKSPTYWTTLPF
jgi:hypothetical protein